MKRIIAFVLAAMLLSAPALALDTLRDGAIDVKAPSAVLMEKTSGAVIYEKDAHARLSPASVTKVMTLLLVFEALDQGRITWDDAVTASETAAAKGGSQIFLEPGETMPIRDMIKAARANDEGRLEYAWRNPLTQKMERKQTWFVRVGQQVIAVGVYAGPLN